MAHGGRRTGSGRKPRPLANKIAEGNPGHGELKVLEFTGPKVKPRGTAPAFLDAQIGDDYRGLPTAGEIYGELSVFVESSGCAEFVSDVLIESFSSLYRSFLECETLNKAYGRIVEGKTSPYVNMALKYHKELMSVYSHIWAIIVKNSKKRYDEGKNEFLNMLQKRPG